jgi:hypothetical protein
MGKDKHDEESGRWPGGMMTRITKNGKQKNYNDLI